MSTQELSGTMALVTGGSRGFGRAIAIALSEHGAHVVGVARDRAQLEELRAQLGGIFTPVAADAADPVVAGQLLDQQRPRTLVLNAGAAPLARPIHRQTWQTFSRNWEVDVQHVFNWTREALLLPLEPGSVVVAFSSGAAVNGSPLSGGYAGAKATIRFIASGRSSLRKQTWARPQSPATPPGRASISPPSSTAAAQRSPRSRWATRSSTLSPAPAKTGTPTCSPPPASARCTDTLRHPLRGRGVLLQPDTREAGTDPPLPARAAWPARHCRRSRNRYRAHRNTRASQARPGLTGARTLLRQPHRRYLTA